MIKRKGKQIHPLGLDQNQQLGEAVLYNSLVLDYYFKKHSEPCEYNASPNLLQWNVGNQFNKTKEQMDVVEMYLYSFAWHLEMAGF